MEVAMPVRQEKSCRQASRQADRNAGSIKSRNSENAQILPDEMGVGVGVAVSQVHNIIIMGEGECESEGVLWGSIPANHATLVVADAASNPGPPPAL